MFLSYYFAPFVGAALEVRTVAGFIKPTLERADNYWLNKQ